MSKLCLRGLGSAPSHVGAGARSRAGAVLLAALVGIVPSACLLGACKPRRPSGEKAQLITEKGAWGRAVVARLQQLEPRRQLRFDEAAFEIAFEDGETKGAIALTNHWAEATAASSSVDEVADRIHRSLGTNASNGLLPILRERVTIEVDAHLRAEHDPKLGSSDRVPYRPIADVLAIGLVEDRANTVEWLSNKGLEEKKLTFDVSLASATRALLARPAPAMKTLAPGAFRFDGDEYGATRFFLGAMEKGLSVRGDAVAFFVSRETVLVTGSDDVEGQKALLQEVSEEVKKPRAWTPRLLRRRGTTWVRFEGTPIATEVQRRGVLADYDRQTKLLRSYARDEDPFTAEAIAVQNKKNGNVFTMATLTETVDTLLPEVELVSLALWEKGKARHIGVVRFDVLEKTMGPRMTKTPHWPVRYRIAKFPTSAEVKAMQPQAELP